jgi:hypothetical protein
MRVAQCQCRHQGLLCWEQLLYDLIEVCDEGRFGRRQLRYFELVVIAESASELHIRLNLQFHAVA